MSIDGWLSPREAGALYDLAKAATGPIVEIGSFRGRSTTALALGSMAGHRQPVYAIDPFTGAAPRKGETRDLSCSRAKLRGNLDAAGVNGLAIIVPAASETAAPCIPACSVLFVDGDHSAAGVARDLDLYLPKVLPGGSVVLHDVTPETPGVAQAVDQRLLSRRDEWFLERRIDTAVVARRTAYPRHKIYLAFPGGNFGWHAVGGLIEASKDHDVQVGNNANGFDDFNVLWAEALNRFESGAATHFAMLHSDVAPLPGWLDVLIAELEDHEADLVSTIIPIKDGRGLTSSGIADPENPWEPWRRFTLREAAELPPTFGPADVRHLGCDPAVGRHLLHNTGCWVCDLRAPLFRQVDDSGALKCWFDFPTKVARDPRTNQWRHWRESEDWFFSRRIAQAGARTFITRKIELVHYGGQGFPNNSPWGTYTQGDSDTIAKWNPTAAAETETRASVKSLD